MPMFDYNCPKCSNTFEEIAKHDDEVKCNKCETIADKKITGCSFKVTGPGAANIKMQVKGHVVSSELCKADRDG